MIDTEWLIPKSVARESSYSGNRIEKGCGAPKVQSPRAESLRRKDCDGRDLWKGCARARL